MLRLNIKQIYLALISPLQRTSCINKREERMYLGNSVRSALTEVSMQLQVIILFSGTKCSYDIALTVLYL